MREERLAELMVKAADGVATDEETEELMAYAQEHPELREELAAHQALKAVTDAWVDRLQVDGLEDAWMSSSATRLERGVGVVLLFGGLSALMGFGMWELWLDPEAPLWVKGGTAMVLGGLLVLLGSVVRWKWQTSGSDRYSEVVR